MTNRNKHTGNKKSSQPSGDGRPLSVLDKRLAYTCGAYLSLFVVLSILASKLDGLSWGIGYAGYLIFDLDMLLVLIVMLIGYSMLTRLGKPFETLEQRSSVSLRYWSIAAFITAVFVFISTQVHVLFPLLGDGSSYAAEIIRMRADAAYNTFLIKPTSWLTGVLIQYIARHSATVDTTWPFALTDTVALGVLAVGFFTITRHDAPIRRILAGCMVFATSASLFFLGYVELYAMQFAFTALFFLSMHYDKRNGAARFLPALFLGVAVLFGGSSIIFLPALVVYFLPERLMPRSVKYRTVIIASAVLQIMIIAVMYAAAGTGSGHQYLLPIMPDSTDINGGILNHVIYTVFSVYHISDLIQVLLLNCGVSIFIFAAFMKRGFIGVMFGSRKMAALLTAAVSGLLMLMFGNTMFGLGRDWDMAVIATLPINFIALGLLVKAIECKFLRPSRAAVLVVIAMVPTCYAWIRVNTSEASVRRFDYLLALNEEAISVRWTYNGLENLRKYYVKYSKQDDIYNVLKRMADTRFNTIDTFEKMFEMSINGYRPDKVMDDLLSLLEREATSPFPENDTRRIPPLLLRQKAVSMLFDAMQMGFIRRDDKRIAGLQNAFGEWHALGFIDAVLDSTKTIEAKATAAEAALDGQVHDALLAGTIGRLYAQDGDKAKAVSYLRKALDLDPGRYPEMYMALADILYNDMKDRTGAVEVLERGIRQCRLSPSLPQLREMLNTIGRN